MRPPTEGITLTIDGSPIPFTVTPLLPALVQAGLAAGAEPQWHIIEPTTAIDAGNPWDFCHQLVSQGLGIADDPPPQFAEPDFAQQWVSKAPEDALLALTTVCQVTEQKTGPEGYPGNPDKFWYQDNAHSQLGQALASFPVPASGDCLRVAHLDTGYDPSHQTLPVNLELALQRNFVDSGRPNDASDDTSGPLNNLGHGTGTLSIPLFPKELLESREVARHRDRLV
jgi:hypothetical protein